MSEQTFNFKEWYEKNGESLNQSRRLRYQGDPAYREQVLKTNREARERKRAEAWKEREKELAAIKVLPRGKPWKEFTVSKKGKATKTFTIGALAEALDRSVQAIRIWEKKKLIPPPSLKSAKGDRLYTPDDVARIIEKLQAHGKLEETRGRPPPRLMLATFAYSDGSTITTPVFRVGILAAALGKSVVTVEQMEKSGRLPATPFRHKSHRIYTANMIEATKQALDASVKQIAFGDWTGFTQSVTERWTQDKVFDAQLIQTTTEEKANDEAGG